MCVSAPQWPCVMSPLACATRVAQALFVYLLASTELTKPEYDEDAVAQYRSWRRNEAHEVASYDRLTDRTLASRVCTVTPSGPHTLAPPPTPNMVVRGDESETME